MRNVVVGVAGAALLVFTTSAWAQPQPSGAAPTSTPDIQRSGFIIGFSLGGGSMVPDCDGCESLSGLALDFHLGGMLKPDLALMFDAYGVVHSEEGVSLINSVDTVALQYWVAPQVWIKGGLGLGRLSVSEDGNTIGESDSGLAVLLAGGVEVLQTQSFALDAQLRIGNVSYDGLGLTNASLNLGFNWY